MPSKDLVRSYQAAIARHVAEHGRAVARYQNAMSRRDHVLACQEAAVSAAKHAVDQTVIGMADALGADLTAELLELDGTSVRKLLRGSKSQRSDSDAQ
jgi:hypothetical protein